MNDVMLISLIGAGLVLLGLMLLWLLMDILVRLCSQKRIPETEKINIPPSQEGELLLRQKAAAAATAVALAQRKAFNFTTDEKPEHILNAWQSSHRHQQLHNKPHHIQKGFAK